MQKDTKGERIDQKAAQPLISTPLRTHRENRTMPILRNFFRGLAQKFPKLQKQLTMAEIKDEPDEYVQKAFFMAAAITVALEFATYAALSMGLSLELPYVLVGMLALLLVYMYMAFMFAMMQPIVAIAKRGRDIDAELLYAGRHILIELRSGVTLFDALLGVSQGYGAASGEFNKIIEKITLGVPASVAMHDVVANCPSQYFNRVVLQISNSLMSGSDVGDSLEVALEQIGKEQVIALKSYGQKLNPIVMFFMLFGVIIPSLGVAFLVILLSFLGSSLTALGANVLIGVLVLLAIVQFMFLSMVESSRPSFDLV
jgi:flagellar protein FlaJ